jgi:hypothetical protein
MTTVGFMNGIVLLIYAAMSSPAGIWYAAYTFSAFFNVEVPKMILEKL